MKTLITISLLTLSLSSFAGSVGENSTECLHSQSTQKRGPEVVVETSTPETSTNEDNNSIQQ